MSETLWAPWRMDYILGKKPEGCVFCTALKEGEKKHASNLILRVLERAFVMMNRFPYSHAHIMILPNRHVARIEDLSTDETRELFDLVVSAQTILVRALKPQGMNVGINIGTAAGAGIDDHLHVHVVPRWHGDTNFMPVLADARVMPEHLDETYKQLREYFEAAGTPK
jgi:ATP adenylyltransferase